MTEKRFTLDEARKELALRECSNHNHDWTVIVVRDLCDRFDRPIAVTCERCGEYRAVGAARS